MKNLAHTISSLLLISFLAFIPSKSEASHAAGMELYYRHISGNSYEFTMTFYRNCLGSTSQAPNSFQLGAKSPSLNFSNNSVLTLNRLPTFGTNVPKLQPDNIYNCTKSSLCYEEYVYRGVLNLNNLSPVPLAKDWVFFAELCCRPGGAAAPDNIPYSYQYVECGLNNKDFANNDSPFWHNSRPVHPGHTTDTVTNYLMRTMCTDNYYTFDQSVVEYEGDTVLYSFIEPRGQNGNPTGYLGAYSLANPLPFYSPPAGPGFNIDPHGIINVIPSPPANPADNIFVISIKATEYRMDTIIVNSVFTPVMKEIGYVIRDMTLFIDGPTTCRKDFVHPFPNRVDCGDSVLTVKFRSAPNEWSRVRCETISPDGTEFRLVDSSTTPPRSIAILEAQWTCGSGNNTSVIKLPLAERLDYRGEYYLFTKVGTDLDVLESECGFVEPEFSGTKLRFKGGTPVALVDPDDKLYDAAMAVCLPTEDPFPLLRAQSDEAVEFIWTFNGDTLFGHDIDSLWAQEAGTYQVLVRGPYGCPGSDQIDIYFPFAPEFDFDLPPYCDTTLTADPNNLPPILTVPQSPVGGTWHWEYDFGPPNGFDLVKTGDSLATIGPGSYKLVYQDTAVAPGIPGCITDYVFEFSRTAHPPEQPLNIFIDGDGVLCEEGGKDALLFAESQYFKPNFKAKPGYGPNTPYFYQWYQGDLDNPILNANDSSIIRGEEATYFLFVQDQYGCVGMDSITLKRVGKPGSFEVFCNVLGGKRGRFTWNAQPLATSYEVSIDDGITWINTENNFFEVDDIRTVGSVLVKANVNNVCGESDVSSSYPCAAEIFPPNVFSPNKDGINDFFNIGSLDLFPESTVKIFDRWGTIVFESDDYKGDWDGGDAPEGTYYYIINVNDPAESVYKGVVTLLR